MTTYRRNSLLFLTALALSVGTAAATTQGVESIRPALPVVERHTVELMAAPEPDLIHHVRLPAMEEEDIRALLERNQSQKRMEVGLGRELNDKQSTFRLSELHWQHLSGGDRVAHLQLQSPDARALRAGIRVSGLPEGVRLRFYAPDDQSVSGRVADPGDMRERVTKNGLFWSPTVEGEYFGIELYAPSNVTLGRSELQLPQLSHLLTSVQDRFQLKDLGQVGESGSCNVDVECEDDAAWRDVADSVAKYFFTDSDGGTFMCTGTLLNDEASSNTPYFLTANHCVSSQSIASTIETFWFFERETCGGPDPTSVESRDGGATLLETGSYTDFTLLELNDTPPVGVAFAGWNNEAITNGSILTAIHHPSGDLKKISFGDKKGYSSYSSASNDPDATHIRIVWSISGTTETGSSGSALFNDSRQVVGNLHGGGAACSGDEDNGQPDWYGRFDYSHNCLVDHLGGTANGECASARDEVLPLADGVSQSGTVEQGLWVDYGIDVPADTGELTVTLSDLTADGDLYVRHAELPTEGEFDCRSWDEGTATEVCYISDPAEGTWYVGVNGWETTDYTILAELGSGDGGGGGDDGDDGDDGSGGGSGGGSSGGCQLADKARLDPLMPILALLAMAGLMRRGQRLRLTR